MRGSLRSPWQLERTLTTGRTSRNTLRFPLPCKLRSYSPVVTPEQTRDPPRNLNGDLTSLRQHKRLPEFPVVPGEKSQASHHNWRKTRKCPHQREMRCFFPAAPREQSRVPSPDSRRGVTSFIQLRSPRDSVTIRDET